MAEISLDALQLDRQVGLASWWSFFRDRMNNLERLCGPTGNQAEERLMRLVCAINREAILSEGQLATIMQCDRVEVRRLWQDAPNRAEDQ